MAEEIREQAERTVSWLPRALAGVRAVRWEAAKALEWLERTGAYQLAGYTDLAELALELGLSRAELRRLIRAVRFAQESGLADELSAVVDPEIADVFRRIPEEELPQVLALFREHPLPVAWQEFHDRYGPERMKRFHVISARGGKVHVREVRARTEEEVEVGPDEVLIRGGTVVRGEVEHD